MGPLAKSAIGTPESKSKEPAMAVAVKNATQTAPRPPLNRLAVGSLAGTVYLIVSLVLVFYAIPKVWGAAAAAAGSSVETSAVQKTLLGLVMLGAAVGLSILGFRFVGSNPPQGLRAGIFTGFLGVLLALLI